MSDQMFIPKRIVVVVPNGDLAKSLNRPAGLLEQLQGAGHTVVQQFSTYNEAYMFFAQNPDHDADTIIVSKPEKIHQHFFDQMMMKFDALPDSPTEADFVYSASRVVIAVNDFSIGLPDPRFNPLDINEELKLKKDMTMDNKWRSESRLSDYKINISDLNDQIALVKITSEIGQLFRGQHQLKKEADLRAALGRDSKEFLRGDTPVVIR